MADLHDQLAGLSPEKRALLEKRLRERKLAQSSFPLSVMQQRLWFLEQMSRGNLAYVIPAAVQVDGPLDSTVLEAVLNEIARRHESIRTVFRSKDGTPVQIVQPQLRLELPIEDLRQVAGEAREAAITEQMNEVFSEPFDLSEGPLLRFRLLRLADQEHLLVMAMHHIISDGWSLAILVSEVARLYGAFVAGKPSPLPPLKIQYVDFATWQQGWLKGEGLKADLEYWRERLAGAPPVVSLTTDRPRPPIQTFRGGSRSYELPAELMRELTAVAQRQKATTFMALLAVFQVLLSRYTGQEDIVVGIPIANRNRAEVESLIGFFINNIAVRTDLAGNPSFNELLRRVRESCLGAYAHQDLPFEKLVEDLQPARDLSRPPIFQVSFSYQAAPLPTIEVAGIRLSRRPLQATTARYDLELQFFEEQGRLTGWLEYNRDLYDDATIERLADHFRRLVEAVVADATQTIGQLPLLGDEERHQLLVAGNATDQEWPGVGWIHQCFEEQVRQHPQAAALCFEDQQLSYRELNERANQLAHRLRRLGVERDVVVGICMERSIEMEVGLLGIIKAGGAYLPLDPAYPPARLHFMLEDSQVPILLTQRRLQEQLPEIGATVLCIDELAEELAAEPQDNPEIEIEGDDLAYVIYTSGSTGQPKGVMNRHSAIRNRLLWMQDAYQLNATDRVLQKTPFSFDVSVWELFWPLMTGACLVMARPEGHKDSQYLIETICSQRITTMHFVPSMLQVFLQAEEVERCHSLRRVICSGEALPRELQDRFYSRCEAELHNLYGPTEAAVDVTFWACHQDDEPGTVPIGHPIANTQIYLLDRFQQPVPVGVPGELYIGGANLARGYLNRAELTEQRFIADPFATTSGARLYRTGDLARFRNDGAIEYLGRLDHQVKLRGFRIELGEIEEVLTGHDQVREAIVLAREHHSGLTRLVAYLTGDSEPATGELISYLKERLPEYMVPAAFVHVPVFPLTPNGKVDRAALPEPELDRAELGTPFVAPRDQMEQTIAEAWSNLLGVEQLGVDDNFFDLGGHSLLMAQLQNLLQTRLERSISMVELFQYPTVRSLAEFLSRSADSQAEAINSGRERAAGRRESLRRRRQATAARRSRAASEV